MSENKQTVKKPPPGNGGTVLPGPGPGRPKGSVNKFTSLKDSFLSVYERMGGEDALLAFADKHKPLFYGWITKMLPSNITADVKGTIDGKLTLEVIHLKGADVSDGDNGNGNGNGNEGEG